MAAPLGSKYWLRRNPPNQGRPLAFETPELLWEAAVGYFEWANANPLVEHVMLQTQKEGPKPFTIDKMRALTVTGMCLYIDISSDTYNEYRKRPDYKDVCSRIDDLIYTQKFDGAAAGLLNQSIIARDLGLVEKTASDVKTTHAGSVTSTVIDVRALSRDQLAALASIRIPALTYEPELLVSTPIPADGK